MFHPGLMKDCCTIFLGVVQIRQLRVEPMSCTVPEELESLDVTCDGEWNPSLTGQFEEYDDTERMKNVWLYKTPAEVGSDFTMGIDFYFLK